METTQQRGYLLEAVRHGEGVPPNTQSWRAQQTSRRSRALLTQPIKHGSSHRARQLQLQSLCSWSQLLTRQDSSGVSLPQMRRSCVWHPAATRWPCSIGTGMRHGACSRLPLPGAPVVLSSDVVPARTERVVTRAATLSISTVAVTQSHRALISRFRSSL